MRSKWRTLLLFAASISCTLGFQFVIGGDETSTGEECFVVELPQDTSFVAKYNFPGAGFGSGSGAVVTLTDTGEGGKEMFRARVAEKEGVLPMTSGSDARHNLCVTPEGALNKPVVFSLYTRLGRSDSYYQEMAASEHLDRLQLEVVRLTDQLAQLLDEADYMKEREVEFHEMTETMNTNAQWWPILQITILLLTGVFQVKNLKRFFQKQKMLY
mmetsp:Transcript_26143/g.58580  ORF Transcript_26143/g.58580 Transcript_26143/m.58580 type:complete len:214 (-) Transcript_26143:180-821(-)|eukprot:CAMPEP_0172617090 /NCGR_PEP_ID=MMETSP1068-20121228/70029_1 /TAXON_ID=35684 /ORGANISM="Pseudopedinella elastica, Strain CCMP716" /LENGTH=213 /DNA_ID=CAMNT_0013422759 /DNA_START=84 /DNA_END=725 /DNA_ORIENTATION=-